MPIDLILQLNKFALLLEHNVHDIRETLVLRKKLVHFIRPVLVLHFKQYIEMDALTIFGWSQNRFCELADLVEVDKVYVAQVWHEDRVSHISSLVDQLGYDIR